MNVTLPDGSALELPDGATALDAARAIGPKLAEQAVLARVNGEPRDLRLQLPDGASLQLLTTRDRDDPDALYVLRHSAAHLLAEAVRRLHPGVKVAIGPPIENGFYYDFEFPQPIREEDLAAIEAEVAREIAEGRTWERTEIGRDEARARFEAAYGVPVPPHYGWHLTQMFHAMERGELRTLYVIGENPAQSEADVNRTRRLLAELDLLVVQDIVMTRTAEMADVVLPSTASWCEAEGTVTNSERRVQRVRKALDPPGDARDDMWILCELARRLGHDWGHPTAEEAWDELRSLSPMHAGMRYDRLDANRGLRWPCPDEDHPGAVFLHERLWAEPVEGPRAPFSVVEAKPPFEALDADYPIRLTTGRRLESYNTGAQSNRYRSPLHRGEALQLSPEDAERLEVSEGEIVRVSSRRGSVEAPVRIDDSLRAGLAFMSFHFPDQVDVNQLTIDATDPKSGTAEFKAAAIRVDRLEPAEREAGESVREPAEARG